jgi:EPS-associated MarR family transcriptional regulator
MIERYALKSRAVACQKTMEQEISLKILQTLEKKPELTQRQLAKELGVSLGKINYCLQALKEKGWIKAKNFKKSNHKIGYIHLLTPSGIASKLALTNRFLEYKKNEYEFLKKEIDKLEEDLIDVYQETFQTISQ